MLRAIASNYAALAAQVGWLVVLTPFLAAQRGAVELGAWTVAMSVAGYLRLLDLGIGPTFARFVAADHRGERRTELLSTGLAVLVAAAVATGLIGIGLAVAASSVFEAGSTDVGQAVAVAVVGSALQVPLRLFSHLLYGLDRLVERNAFTVARLALSLAITVGGVLAGWSLPGYLAAAMGTEVAVSGVQAAWVMWRTPGARPSLRAVRRSTLVEMSRFGMATFGLQAATQIVYYSDALVIGAVLGTRSAGIYAVAMRLVEGASLLVGQIADAFMPVLTRMQAGARALDARALALLGAPALLLVASPVIAVLAGLGGPLIELWVGDGYGGATLPLAMLAVGLAFNAPLRFPVLWALGAGRHHRIAAYAVGEALTNVALSLALVGPLGLDGVALASLVTLAVSNGFLIPRALSVELAAAGRDWYGRPLVRTLALCAPVVGGAALLGEGGLGTVMTLAATLALAATVVAIAAFAAVDAGQRQLLGSVLRRRRTSPV